MVFVQSTSKDINTISTLYDLAAAFQRSQGMINWQGFDRSIIEQSIKDGFQWQILIDDTVACVFTLALSDPLIWGERNIDPVVYIHRIATNPKFRGFQFVKSIIAWVSTYATSKSKRYIRLDTLSGNEKLHNYYIDCGFTYLGSVKLKDATALPVHYQNGMFSLFEIELN